MGPAVSALVIKAAHHLGVCRRRYPYFGNPKRELDPLEVS